MKRILTVFILILFLCGCAPASAPAQIAATTLPVYEFTARLCEGTGITVTRLVTEEVSCLHDYSLNVSQVKAAEAAEHIVISGAGLEEFIGGDGIALVEWPEMAEIDPVPAVHVTIRRSEGENDREIEIVCDGMEIDADALAEWRIEN